MHMTQNHHSWPLEYATFKTKAKQYAEAIADKQKAYY